MQNGAYWHIARSGSIEFFEHCIMGNILVWIFQREAYYKGQFGVHSCRPMGPSQTPSLGGSKYYLCIIDDFSRKVWTYILKTKDETFINFKHWKLMLETQREKNIIVLRTDKGLEFCKEEFDSFCWESGVQRHKIGAEEPQYNRFVERMSRMILEKVRCMLSNAQLQKNYWAKSLQSTTFLINRSPSLAIEFKTL